jgi:electron transfer flavoprotein beta subunit
LTEDGVQVGMDGSVRISPTSRKISDYDLHAIEAAVDSARHLGVEAVGISLGDSSTGKSAKDALSRGLDKVYWVNTRDSAGQDALSTSHALAACISAYLDPDLVICADGSSDVFARQTGPRLGVILGWPVVTSVVGVEFAGRTLIARRAVDDFVEVVEVALPAVVSVLPAINQLTPPGIRQIMAAAKKPSREVSLADLGVAVAPAAVEEGVEGLVTARKSVLYDGADADAAVEKLVSALRVEGMV